MERFNAGALREAVQDLTRAIELNPEFVAAHRMLADAYERLGDPRLAAAERRLGEMFQN